MQLSIHISYQRRQVIVHICVHCRRPPPPQPTASRLHHLRLGRLLSKVCGGRSPCTTSLPCASLGSLCRRCVVHALCGLVIAVTLATALNNNNNNNNIDARLDVIDSGRHAPPAHQPRDTTLGNYVGQGYQAQAEGIGVGVDAHLKHYRSKIRTNLGRNELVGINRRDVSEIEDVLSEGPPVTATTTSTSSTSTTVSSTSTTTAATTSKSVLHAGVAPTSVVNHPDGPMPPVHESMDSMGSNVVVWMLVAALVLATLGGLFCILSTYRYRSGGGGAHRGGSRGGSSWPHSTADMPSDTPGLLGSNANMPMLALPAGMCAERLSHDRLIHDRAAMRDKHVRLKSVQTDMELDLPPNIRLPDGEERPYGYPMHIRDSQQESEIYQKCVRAPPNRTVYEGESPPPYRSSSAGLLSHGTSAGGSSDWSTTDGVIRCHSMSSHAPATALAAPCAVVVPSRSRRLSAYTDAAAPTHCHRTGGGGVLAQLTMVPCHAERPRRPTPPPPSQSV